MRYAWVNGKARFYVCEKDGKYYFEQVIGGTPIAQPSSELLERLDGRTFKNKSEIEDFIENGEIEYLKKKLADSDYQVIKCYEYQLVDAELPYNISELHTERQALRDRINQLEVV